MGGAGIHGISCVPWVGRAPQLHVGKFIADQESWQEKTVRGSGRQAMEIKTISGDITRTLEGRKI